MCSHYNMYEYMLLTLLGPMYSDRTKHTLKFCRGLWIPGKGMAVLQNFQKFRVRVWVCYRTSRSFGYCGGGIQNSQKFRAGTKHAVPVPRILWHGSCRTHKNCTGLKVVQNFQKFRVRGYESLTEVPEVPGIVARAYRTSRSLGRYKHAVPVSRVFVAPAYRTSIYSGYGYECPTEVTEVICRVIPGVNTPGVVLCVPYRHIENRKFGYGYEYRTEPTGVLDTSRVVQNSQKSWVRVIPG